MKNIEVPPNLMLLGCKLIMGWPSVTSIDSQDTRSFSVHSGLRSINQVFPLQLDLLHNSGSCHGGWCWEKLTPILRKSRHEVYTNTLTGLGERSNLVSKNVSLNTHIQDVTQMFEYEDLSGVILVDHSYGGLVISGVAEKLANRIKCLVYLDGYLPENGKSAFDLIPGLKEIYEKRASNEKGKEWLVSWYRTTRIRSKSILCG